MSDLSVLMQARKEIKAELKAELAQPKWSQAKKKALEYQLSLTNELIAQHIENNTEGERTLF